MIDERNGILRLLYGAFRIVVLAGIIIYLANLISTGPKALGPQASGLNFSVLGPAFLIAILAYQLLFAAWLMMLRRTGFYCPGRLRVYARIWWVSYMYRYVPGKVLLIVERARMGTAADIPPAAGAAMPVIETILAILAGSIVSLLAVTFYATGNSLLLPMVVAVMAITVFLLPVGLRFLSQQPFMRRKFSDFQSISLTAGDLLILVVPFLAHYLLLGVSVFLLARGMYLLSWSELPGICGIYALSHVISLLVVLAPGGLGVREGTFAVQLEQASPVGAIAGAIAIAARLLFTIAEVACLIVALVAHPRSNSSRRRRTELEP